MTTPPDTAALEIAEELVRQGRGYGTWENRLAVALLVAEARAEKAEARVQELEEALHQASLGVMRRRALGGEAVSEADFDSSRWMEEDEARTSVPDTEALVERVREALRFWVDRADHFEKQLPESARYMRARGVATSEYELGRTLQESAPGLRSDLDLPSGASGEGNEPVTGAGSIPDTAALSEDERHDITAALSGSDEALYMPMARRLYAALERAEQHHQLAVGRIHDEMSRAQAAEARAEKAERALASFSEKDSWADLEDARARLAKCERVVEAARRASEEMRLQLAVFAPHGGDSQRVNDYHHADDQRRTLDRLDAALAALDVKEEG